MQWCVSRVCVCVIIMYCVWPLGIKDYICISITQICLTSIQTKLMWTYFEAIITRHEFETFAVLHQSTQNLSCNWKFLRQNCRHFSHDSEIYSLCLATSAPGVTSSPCMRITVKCLPQCIPLQSKESTLQFPSPLLSRDVCVQTSMTYRWWTIQELYSYSL